MLDINNPPRLPLSIYKLLADHQLNVNDIEIGPHTELRQTLQFIIDGAKNGTLEVHDYDDNMLIDNDDADTDVITAEPGYGLDNTPTTLYKVGLPVDRLECQFCKKENDFKYKQRQARKQNKTYTLDSEVDGADFSDALLLHYTNVELLYTFLNERGMVTPRL